MFYKRGVSPVVATVLLLVLTVAIAGVVFSVVIPFVKDKLGNSKECIDAFDGIEFPESKFNCYKTSSGQSGETGFSVKINKEGIYEVKVSLVDSNENSDVFSIKEGASNQGLRSIGESYGDLLTFPSAGGQRTYIVSGVYSKAEMSVVSKSGNICSVSDVVEFEPCYGEVSF